MRDIAIVIQGPSDYVVQQKRAWKGYGNHCIFSTWVGEQNKYKSSDNVVFNEIPVDSGCANINYQIGSTLQGLKLAKELGYDRALKLRSDLIPTNYKNFLDTIDNDNYNFLCWHHHMVYHNCPGYLVDYLMSGNVDMLIKLWDINELFCAVPQIMLTWNYIKNCSDVQIVYFLNSLSQVNDLFWIKRGIYLSSYQKNKIYDKYDRFTFGQNLQHLSQTYLSFLEGENVVG